MAASRENALGVLYAAFSDIHRFLSELPVEGVDFDIPSDPTLVAATTSTIAPSNVVPHDCPSTSMQPIPPTSIALASVVPPSTHPSSTSTAATDPLPTALSSTCPPPTAHAPTAPSSIAPKPSFTSLAPSSIVSYISIAIAPLS